MIEDTVSGLPGIDRVAAVKFGRPDGAVVHANRLVNRPKARELGQNAANWFGVGASSETSALPTSAVRA
jgi:hypothetical protein